MKMKFDWLKKHWQKIVWPIVLVLIGVAGYFTQDRWMPQAQRFMAYIQNKKDAEEEVDEATPSKTPDTFTNVQSKFCQESKIRLS